MLKVSTKPGQVHGKAQESNEEEWDKVRQTVNAIDHDEVPTGVFEDGKPVMRSNPYNVVISVMMLKEGWDVQNVKVIVPLRPCESRTLTEQTLGRGLRKMHRPNILEDGSVEFQQEDLYVIEHPSFRTIIEKIRDIVDEKASDEIDHPRERTLIKQKESEADRKKCDVRIVRFEGLIQAHPEWRKTFDVNKLPALAPRLAWMDELPETDIQTFLKKALEGGETEGLSFSFESHTAYRDFDAVLERAYALRLLKELRAGFHHKNAVKSVVKEFLERKVFNLPASVPISLDAALEQGNAKIALGNLARGDVITRTVECLRQPLHEAISQAKGNLEAQLSERSAADIVSYQALKRHVIGPTQRSPFENTALESNDERRVALLLDGAQDVTGWVYNHRVGVAFFIEYSWQGYTAKYFPDFIARARLGEVMHNFIIEAKGRVDDRDKAKARRGHDYCEMLTEFDKEPWHYILLIENAASGRADVKWWEGASTNKLGDLLKHHETLPLLPNEANVPVAPIVIEPSVPDHERFITAVPVYDLQAAAGAFSQQQTPTETGWARVSTKRQINSKMFVAKVAGKSMETAIADGSWGLFRSYPSHEAPSSLALDGKRVVVQLRAGNDPETGGSYTLKRWKVTKTGQDGSALEVELRPDNPAFKPRKVNAASGDMRVVAEFLEVVG